MPRCTPRLTCMVHTTWCVFDKMTNGRTHSIHAMAILSMLWCPLVLRMHFFTNDFFMPNWMILSYVTLMTSSIFSKNLEKHEWHVSLVLDKLREVGLYAKLEKCEFHQTKVEFLGYINSKCGVYMDYHKVQTIVNWATPTSVHDVQCFLWFANFYWHLITHYSTIMAPLTHLIWKDQPFSWGSKSWNFLPIFEGFLHDYPIIDSCKPIQIFFLGDECFLYCIKSCVLTT